MENYVRNDSILSLLLRIVIAFKTDTRRVFATKHTRIFAKTLAMFGHPIPILVPENEHVFALDEEALEKILLQPHIRDCHVAVVSVAGAFRKGKSFLLDFFLRYMNYAYLPSRTTNGVSWIGHESAPLNGFSWRGGSERDTSGILMWSEIFYTTLANGEEVAVVLLDTQGTFDSDSTVRDCATVFALSTMLSSIQIYNLSQNIQEDDLQHLQLFTEYGRLALASTGNKPFQTLQFLVRDWNYPYEYGYGEEGGARLLEKRLKVSEKQHAELQSLRKHIKSCFTEISCFLMPYPGSKVAMNPKFDGRLSDIKTEFKTCLETLVPLLLSPENLVLKEINGQKVKVKELVQYFRSYADVFGGTDLPEPKSVLQATAEADNLLALAAARETYNRSMDAHCGDGAETYLSVDELEAEHATYREKALEQFWLTRKMGGNELSEFYRAKLESAIEIDYNQFKAHNKMKIARETAKKVARVKALVVVVMLVNIMRRSVRRA